MAYLGRISAVLTANTRDFTRQIGTARRELQGFANQARGIQLNLDNRALSGTLTNLQRFRRTLQEIERLQAAGVGAGLPNTRRLNDQFRAFEDLGRPITDIKNKIEGLSNTIQAELYPELEKVQAGFRNLYRDIGNGTTTFDQSGARIENLTRRLTGLSRAVAALSDFGSLTRQLNAGNTGASFFAPRAQEALQQSLALRGQAQGLPSRFREGQFADLAVLAEENAERIERAAARVASAQAQIDQYGETPNRLGRRSRAQAELDAATRQQRGINLQFQREIASAQIQQIVSPEAPRQADTLIERVRTLATQLRAIDRNQFNGLIASTAAVVDQFNRGETSANRARAAVDRLAQSLEAAGRVQAGRQIGADLQEQADRLLFSDRERRQRTVQSAFDTAVANVPAGDPRRRRAELERDITLRRDQLVSEVIPRTQGLADQARQTGDQQAIRDAERLLQINRQISSELTRSANLAQNNNYDESAASLQRVNSLLERQQRLEADIAARVDISNAARRQTQLFLEQSGGVSEQLSQGARDAASDISVARQFRGQIASGGARIEIQQEIDRVTASVTRLQREIAEVAASTLGADAKAAELDRLDNEIRQSTQGLAQFVATRSGGAFSAAQIDAAMVRGRGTAGSIGLGGAASAQLAFQQGLFAIDDFISSTGGIEYKLRAIGNNVTQLGLLLGQSGLIPGLTATTGLFVSLGVVLAGQAAVGLLKWINGSQSASDYTKALNDSLAKQKSLTEQLAQSFESLGDSIAQRAFSSGQRAAVDFSKTLDKIQRQQKELRTERFFALDPESFSASRRASAMERRLGEATDAGQAIALAEAVARNRAAARRNAAAASRRDPGIDNAVRAVGAGPRSRDEEFTRAGAFFSDIASRAFLPFNPVTPFFGSRASGITSDEVARRRLEAARGDRQASIAAVEARRNEIRPLAEADIGDFQAFIRGDSAAIAKARREFAALTAELELLSDAAKSDDALIRFLKSSNAAAAEIESAQSQVAEAIRSGVPGAVALQSRLGRIASVIDDAQEAISRANDEFQRGSQTPEERRQRDEIVRRETERINRTRDARDRAAAQASALDRQRIVDPQSTFDARRSRAEANLDAAGLGGGLIARQLRELEARRSAVESQLAARPDSAFVRRRAEQELAAINQQAAAIESATIALKKFTEYLNRAADEARSNLESARQREEQARREDIGRSTPRSRGARGVAEADLRRQEELNNRVQDEVAKARARLEEQARDPNNQLAGTFSRIEAIDELLASGGLSSQQQSQLIEERRRLQDRIDRAINQEQSVIDARDASTREEERRQSALRGRDLMLRPGQRAALELDQQIADIRARAEERRNRDVFGRNAAAINRDEEEAIRRAREDKMREQAPAIFGLADAVTNALLQGPSRAALQPTDVSTVEGSRELTRLLRGDDAARDQANLVELQKEANRLLDLIANNPANIAN